MRRQMVVDYLQATQEDDGHWAQNPWLDGRPYWKGVQMDETGFPILLYDLLRRAGCIARPPFSVRAMIERAAGFIVRSGQSPNRIDGKKTLATRRSPWPSKCRPAGGRRPMQPGNQTAAGYLRETADFWKEDRKLDLRNQYRNVATARDCRLLCAYRLLRRGRLTDRGV